MRGGPHRDSVFTDWLTFSYILVWKNTWKKTSSFFYFSRQLVDISPPPLYIASQTICTRSKAPFFLPLGGTVYHIELLYRMMHVCLPAPRIFFIWRRRRRRRPTSRSSRVSIRQLTFNDSKKKKTKKFSVFFIFIFLDCELFSIYLSK